MIKSYFVQMIVYKETYILYNQGGRGEWELINLGAPIFWHIKEEAIGKGKDSKNSFTPKHICFSSVRVHLFDAYFMETL